MRDTVTDDFVFILHSPVPDSASLDISALCYFVNARILLRSELGCESQTGRRRRRRRRRSHRRRHTLEIFIKTVHHDDERNIIDKTI